MTCNLNASVLRENKILSFPIFSLSQSIRTLSLLPPSKINLSPTSDLNPAMRPYTPRALPPFQLLDVSQAAAPQQNSPLFNLPVEIWQQIYEDVLGGLAIEIAPYFGTIGSHPQVRICAGTEHCPNAKLSSPTSALRRCYDSLLENEMQLYDNFRHANCQPSPDTDPATLLDLNLLLVCRRIHQEAALLPLQKNTFTVHMADGPSAPNVHPTFQTFSSTLAQEQREALAHLTVVSISCFLASNKHQLPRLKGLRTLHIVQKPDVGLAPMYAALASGWENAGGRRRPGEWRGGLAHLRHLNSVRISQEARFARDPISARSERSIAFAQTPAINGLLGRVEGRLFESLAGRDGEGVSFEECLGILRDFEGF
jgi:hypothetical protein